MKIDFQLDDREFKRALQQYVQETGKDLAYCVNRAALNAAIKSLQNTPQANRARVRAVAKEPWFPKLVSKRLAKNGRRFTRKEAREQARKIIRQKLSTVRWLKSGWRPALKLFSALKLARGGTAGTKDFKDHLGSASPARPGLNPTALLTHATSQNPQALRIARRALQRGLDLAAMDMLQYIRQRCGATARKFSAK